MTFPFTRKRLDRLPLPTGTRVYYRDTDVKGLVLGITANGIKSFCLYQRVQGKPERILLGHYPEIGPERARELALKYKIAISKGTKPKCKLRQGYIYLMWNDKLRLTKIGFSKTPKVRERTLQAEDPGLCLLAKTTAPEQLERALHVKYAQYRKRGEWFDLPVNTAQRLKEWMNDDQEAA